VAAFIGSPAMNLIEGTLESGVFSADNVRISGLASNHSGKVTLGFRAEDALVAHDVGDISAPVYSMELLGEATMVTMRISGALVSVKAGKDYRIAIGDPVTVSVPTEICHLFNSDTGERIE